MVLYIYEKFHSNLHLQRFSTCTAEYEYKVEMAMLNVQKALTPKAGKSNWSLPQHLIWQEGVVKEEF